MDETRLYGIYFSSDTQDWSADVTDSYPADAGDSTTFGLFPNPLTTDPGLPEEQRPEQIFLRVEDAGPKP